MLTSEQIKEIRESNDRDKKYVEEFSHKDVPIDYLESKCAEVTALLSHIEEVEARIRELEHKLHIAKITPPTIHKSSDYNEMDEAWQVWYAQEKHKE